MKKLLKLGCACEKHDLIESEYRTSNIGTDFTDGRNAEVSIIQCKLCQRIWLKYSIETENFPELGRWYKGIIAKKEVAGMRPENALQHLENLEWYLYRDADSGSEEKFGQGKIDL